MASIPVTRLGDLSTGHPCYPATAINNASPDTFVNSKALAGSGDSSHTSYSDHCCGPACHSYNPVTGSPTVFVNGLPVTRQGDYMSCSIICTVDQHSPNVFSD
jgi:uncharacterized Zn-binding protein involved in type VI secretion